MQVNLQSSFAAIGKALLRLRTGTEARTESHLIFLTVLSVILTFVFGMYSMYQSHTKVSMLRQQLKSSLIKNREDESGGHEWEAHGTEKISDEMKAAEKKRANRLAELTAAKSSSAEAACSALEEGMERKDILDVKQMKNRPQVMVPVAHALCVIFKVEPYWFNFTQIISSPDFKTKLEELRRTGISAETLSQVKEYMNTSVGPDKLKKCSVFQAALYDWIQAQTGETQHTESLELLLLQVEDANAEVRALAAREETVSKKAASRGEIAWYVFLTFETTYVLLLLYGLVKLIMVGCCEYGVWNLSGCVDLAALASH